MQKSESCCGGVINGIFEESRLPSSSLGNRDGLEDPLEDTGLVQQQLDQLSTIGRCEYEKTCALLVQLFDQSAQSYQELLQSASASPMDIAVQEGEWMGAVAWNAVLSVPLHSLPPLFPTCPPKELFHHPLPPSTQKNIVSKCHRAREE